MLNIEKVLKKSIIFNNFLEDEINSILKNINYTIKIFSKNSTIAFEGDDIYSLGIILDGHIEIQKNYPSGKNVVINKIKEGGIFGEVIIFSKMKVYPATVFSSTESKILFTSKEDIVKLCSENHKFLYNFMGLLSNKILMLNKKLKNLSYQTIREKIADYIIEEYKKQKSLNIKVLLSRKEMAEHFGITRPSLSRELIKMKKEELIDFDKNSIKIKKLNLIEDLLF